MSETSRLSWTYFVFHTEHFTEGAFADSCSILNVKAVPWKFTVKSGLACGTGSLGHCALAVEPSERDEERRSRDLDFYSTVLS